MKRALLALYAAVLFLNMFVIPTTVRADGDPGGGCNSNCKP